MKTYEEEKMDETVNEFLREFNTTVEELKEMIAYRCIDLNDNMGAYFLVVRLFSVRPRVEFGFHRPEFGGDDYPDWERFWFGFPLRNIDSFPDRYYIGERLPNGDFRALDWDGGTSRYMGTLTPEQAKDELAEELVTVDNLFHAAFRSFIAKLYDWLNELEFDGVIERASQ